MIFTTEYTEFYGVFSFFNPRLLSSRGALATKDLGNIAQLGVDVLEILRFALDDKRKTLCDSVYSVVNKKQ